MIILAFAEGATWYNYPGLELWKFFNLAVLIAGVVYLYRSRISASLATRREAIKQELVHAQETKARAVEKLAEADSQLSRLDSEVRSVHEQSRHEADAERQRVAAATAREIEKLKQQAEREMETADKLARKALRHFFAQKSVQVARDKVRTQMRPEDDRHLIEQSIGELRRARV